MRLAIEKVSKETLFNHFQRSWECIPQHIRFLFQNNWLYRAPLKRRTKNDKYENIYFLFLRLRLDKRVFSFHLPILQNTFSFPFFSLSFSHKYQIRNNNSTVRLFSLFWLCASSLFQFSTFSCYEREYARNFLFFFLHILLLLVLSYSTYPSNALSLRSYRKICWNIFLTKNGCWTTFASVGFGPSTVQGVCSSVYIVVYKKKSYKVKE